VDAPSVVALNAADGSFCWNAVTDWNLYSLAVVGDVVVLFGNACAVDQGGQSVLMALDVATGEERWRLDLPADTSLPSALSADVHSLTIGDNVVVTPFAAGTAGVELSSGEVLWRAEGVAPLAGAQDSVVGVAGGAGSRTMVVLDRLTGDQRWTIELEGEFFGGVAADATTVMVTVGDTTVAYDARTGERRWEAAFVQASDTYAVRIVDGVATGVTGTGPAPNDIRAFDVATGQSLWTKPAFPAQAPEPTDGNIYVTTTEDGAFAALDPKSGALRWKLAGPLNGGVAAGPGLLFVPGTDGGQAIDPGTGDARWTIAASDPDVAILGTADSSVAGIGILPSNSGVFTTYGNCLGS
jgi:outer membrane protein assembly factor BamB